MRPVRHVVVAACRKRLGVGRLHPKCKILVSLQPNSDAPSLSVLLVEMRRQYELVEGPKLESNSDVAEAYSEKRAKLLSILEMAANNYRRYSGPPSRRDNRIAGTGIPMACPLRPLDAFGTSLNARPSSCKYTQFL